MNVHAPPPKTHYVKILNIPSVIVLGGRTFGGNKVMRVELREWN